MRREPSRPCGPLKPQLAGQMLPMRSPGALASADNIFCATSWQVAGGRSAAEMLTPPWSRLPKCNAACKSDMMDCFIAGISPTMQVAKKMYDYFQRRDAVSRAHRDIQPTHATLHPAHYALTTRLHPANP